MLTDLVGAPVIAFSYEGLPKYRDAAQLHLTWTGIRTTVWQIRCAIMYVNPTATRLETV